MSRHDFVLAAVLLIGVAALNACGPPSGQVSTPRPTFVDRGLVGGVPCKPPCWEGLTPGLATSQEVKQRLEELQAEGQITSFYCSGGASNGVCYANRSEDRWPDSVDIEFKSGTVAWISGDIEFHFSVQQLIEAVGEPTWVSLMYRPRDCTCEGNTPVPTPPGHVEYTSFVYPERGLAFGIEVHPDQSGCVCPYAEVLTFNYYPPMSSLSAFLCYRDVVESGGTGTPGPRSLKPSDYVEWHGFGPGYGRK